MALIAVIAVSIVGTVIVLRPDANGGDGQSPNGGNSNSEFASANDTGPVNIITEDPTCAAWGGLAGDLAAVAASTKWNDRDRTVPATAWTPEQRTMYETVGDALTRTAKSTANLVDQTPHRVMRELYGQFIVYSKELVDTIPTYESADSNVSNLTDRLVSGIAAICSAIEYKSAQAVAPLVPKPEAPSSAPVADRQAETKRLLESPNPVCSEWLSVSKKYDNDIQPWLAVDVKIPATEWTPEQKSINEAAASVMTANADNMERLGRKSGNAIMEDIAVLAAQYQRAFVIAIPAYTPNDFYLARVASYLAGAVNWACRAAE